MGKKRKSARKHDEVLFPELHGARYGENHRRRRLFLPTYLEGDSNNNLLRTDAQEHAYQIVCRWADLEREGKLQRKKETTLEGEFLTEVFGEGLGYKLFRENEQEWNLEQKFSVNGGEADAAIGLFEHGRKNSPVAVIELKGPTVNVDRDRFNGRTAVQQCWDYLNALPECEWGIVCNYVSIRLYHRKHTPRAYEHFALQDLRNRRTFEQFHYLLERGGLLPGGPGEKPRAELLLSKTIERQQEVGDVLYRDYHLNRVRLIDHLKTKGCDEEKAIRVTQKLLDRIIFVAFCEDRGLLPARSIEKASTEVQPFHRVTNPRWRNFLDLFRSIDEGNEACGIGPYNGGLFREDTDVDGLELEDDWTRFFVEVGRYDFQEEVNVDVLGHLFELSVHDVERLRKGGIFGEEVKEAARGKMVKSAERKRQGIFYTPPQFTEFVTEKTIGGIIEERFDAIAKAQGVDRQEMERGEGGNKAGRYWRACLETLRKIKVVDPACGSGAFLIKAYDLLEGVYYEVIDHIVYHEGDGVEDLRDGVAGMILRENLYGVDLSEDAVEITQLALWIRSARRGQTLADLSENIVCGNSLVSDAAVDGHALDWEEKFASVFGREAGGFDCVIGNPPWERLKLQEREFFDATSPEISGAVNAATRRKLIGQLKKKRPELYERYEQAQQGTEAVLDYVRTSGRYALTGRGDVNTYSLFAELAHSIVGRQGRVGLVVPSGIATDHTTREFFGSLTKNERLIGLYDFENKAPIFRDVHRSFKFCVLMFGGAEKKCKAADFVFFAHEMEELKEKDRHIALSSKNFKLLNPNTRTCPVFRSRRDAELTKGIYERVPVLVDKGRKEGGNPWGIRFFTMFHQTNDAELFRTAEELKAARHRRDGAVWRKGKKVFLPLYEAKMVQMYDHRAASVVVKDENWMRQGQTDATSEVQHQNPEYVVEPRWWVAEENVLAALKKRRETGFVSFKDITSPTNQRTMIAAAIPWCAVTNHLPLVLTSEKARRNMCLLGNLNCLVFDYIVRQKIGGVTLNFFIVEQLPVFGPSFYQEHCPWSGRQRLEKWISERVLKLTCTSDDMRTFAEEAGFKAGVYEWRAQERQELQAELDAAYFVLYGIGRDDAEYILSTFSGIRKEGEAVFGKVRPSGFSDIMTVYAKRCGNSEGDAGGVRRWRWDGGSL